MYSRRRGPATHAGPIAMSFEMPPLPEIALELLEDVSPEQPPGFLRVVRRRLRALYPDGDKSVPFTYDEVDRRSIDAVVLVAYYRDDRGEPWVYLRSALRPPIVFRDSARSPRPDADPRGSIWELPAGLVEPGEQSESGLREAAVRELHEEIGFRLSPDAFEELGPSTFPAPGVLAERHFFYCVEVDPAARAEPPLDGSPLEHGGAVASVPVAAALDACRRGVIPDAKTELALRRLEERLA